MSPSQTNKYWRRWSHVQTFNRWKWIKNRLVEEAIKDAGPHHEAVWRLAGQLANQNCRAITANDLRHGCHVHAFGRDISHDDLSNPQFDRLLLLWGDERSTRGLLIDPLELSAQILWDNPEQAKRASLIKSINALADHEYICAITQDIWGTIWWEDNLDNAALLGLLRKLKGNRPT